MAAQQQQQQEGSGWDWDFPDPIQEPGERLSDGCLYNQEGQLCLLSYFTDQEENARPSPAEKVLAWLDRIEDPPGEEQTLGEQVRLAREMGLVDLADLPPSPIGGPAPNRDGEVEDIIQGAIDLLNNQDQTSPDTTMAEYANYPEAAGHESRGEAVEDFQAAHSTPTPILGNFIPVSSPSPSPHPQLLQPAVYDPSTVNSTGQVNASATDMDKRTADKMASSTRSRSRSPVKQGSSKKDARRSRSMSPVKASRRVAPCVSFEEEDSYHSSLDDNSFGNGKGLKYPGTSGPIAERRNQASPARINTHAANQQARSLTIRRAGAPTIVEHRTSRVLDDQMIKESPAGAQFKPTFTGDDASSIYSGAPGGLPTASSARVDPLFAKESDPRVGANRESDNPVFASYHAWEHGRNLRNSGFGIPQRRGSQKHSGQQQQHMVDLERKPVKAGYSGEPYTPLGMLFPGGQDVSPRKASKTMIGAKGWLEDTTASPDKKTPTPKKISFFENLKTKAKSIMDISHDKAGRLSAGKPDASNKDGKMRELLISLDPREQSLLYCELEFIIHQALSGYITMQFNSGRLSTHKLDKISDEWKRKGRPKVVGFRYDLETQLDLIRLHMNEFMFYKRDATPAVLLGIIDMMRVNARAIKVRTYCQPDTVIAKQLLDAQNLFNVLGSSEDEHVQLASITSFYKTVLDREKSFHGSEAPQNTASTSAGNFPSRSGAATPSGLKSPDEGKHYYTTPTRRRSVINRTSPYPWPGVGIDRSPLDRLDET